MYVRCCFTITSVFRKENLFYSQVGWYKNVMKALDMQQSHIDIKHLLSKINCLQLKRYVNMPSAQNANTKLGETNIHWHKVFAFQRRYFCSV